jgi:hypothetical protein
MTLEALTTAAPGSHMTWLFSRTEDSEPNGSWQTI